MPTAWTQIHYHIVFGTKLRQPLITDPLAKDLYPFLGGITRDLGCSLVAIGGMPDHVHLLIRSRPDVCVSDLLRHLKGRSSKWANEERTTLYWQKAYGAFSVSKSALEEVEAYILNQAEHHKRLTYKDEFELFLARNGIDFKPEDLWNDADR
jgi:REP element-mobilizing transposase RayT